MKLKQKLATVMVAATVISSVPVVTNAASTNRVTKNVVVVKNTSFQSTTAPALIIEAKDSKVNEEFLIELNNSEWNDWDAEAVNEIKLEDTVGCEVVLTSKNTARVKITAAKATLEIPMYVTVTAEGSASVTIDKGNSSVTEETYEFATTTKAGSKLAVAVGNAPTIYAGGKVADITLTEGLAGALAKGGQVILDLNHADYEFVIPTSGKIALETGKGLAGETVVADIAYGKYDDQVIITLPEVTSTIKGTVTIKGLEVTSTVKAPKEGDITVDLSGTSVDKQRNVKVATVATYGGSVATTEVVEAVNCGTAEIDFMIAEKVADSFRKNSTLEVTLDKGYFVPVSLDANGKYDEAATIEALCEAVVVKNYKGISSTVTTTVDLNSLAGFDLILDAEQEFVIGFEFKSGASYTKMAFEATIGLPMAVEGAINVNVEGRALGSDTYAIKVAEVTPAFEITTETADVKVGLSKQTVGKITIKENAEEALKDGQNIEINLGSDFTFTGTPVVEVVEGDLEIGKVKYTTNADKETVLTVEVKRESRTASTLEIKDFIVTANGFIADGAYDITIGGAALSNFANDTVEVKGFFNAFSKEAEEVVVNKSAFTINSNSYVVNGVEKTMDVPAYISAEGRTMIPVRFLSESLGINSDNVIWTGGDQQTVTILDGNRIVQLKANSNEVMVNGAKFTIDGKVEIKDGRAFAPVGEVARILGCDVTWDNETKTASFER